MEENKDVVEEIKTEETKAPETTKEATVEEKIEDADFKEVPDSEVKKITKEKPNLLSIAKTIGIVIFGAACVAGCAYVGKEIYDNTTQKKRKGNGEESTSLI